MGLVDESIMTGVVGAEKVVCRRFLGLESNAMSDPEKDTIR